MSLSSLSNDTCPQPGNFYTIPKLSSIVKQFLTEQGNQLNVYDINDIITLAKDLKMFRQVD